MRVGDLVGGEEDGGQGTYGKHAVVEYCSVVPKEGLEEAGTFVVPAYFIEVAQDVGVVVILPKDGSAIGEDGDELVGVLG